MKCRPGAGAAPGTAALPLCTRLAPALRPPPYCPALQPCRRRSAPSGSSWGARATCWPLTSFTFWVSLGAVASGATAAGADGCQAAKLPPDLPSHCRRAFRCPPAVIAAWVLGLMTPFFLLLHKLKLMRVPVGACARCRCLAGRAQQGTGAAQRRRGGCWAGHQRSAGAGRRPAAAATRRDAPTVADLTAALPRSIVHPQTWRPWTTPTTSVFS